MKLTQVELRSDSTMLVCWVDKPVRITNVVKLKNDERRWIVTGTYESRDSSQINHGWHNNI